MTLRILFLIVFAALSLASQGYAGGPRLTLLFCANTEGEVRPCPS